MCSDKAMGRGGGGVVIFVDIKLTTARGPPLEL